MKWPWAKGDSATVEPEGEDMGRGYAGEEWDDEVDEGLEGGEPETEDELAELDEDTRALVTARETKAAAAAAAATAAQQAAVREALQAQGFDLTADGRPVISDPAKVREFALGLQQRQEQPAPKQETPAVTPEDDPKPDRYTDPDGYDEWRDRQTEKRLKAAFEAQLAQLAPRLDQAESFHHTVQEERDIARVMALLPDTPGNEVRQMGAQEYRGKFQEAFLHHYRGVAPAQRARLSDEDLETLAFAAARSVLPRKGKPVQDERGRFTSPQSVNARLYADSWQQHPDGARAPQRRAEASEEEREYMKRYGMSERELAALSGPAASLSDYRNAQAKAKK